MQFYLETPCTISSVCYQVLFIRPLIFAPPLLEKPTSFGEGYEGNLVFTCTEIGEVQSYLEDAMKEKRNGI